MYIYIRQIASSFSRPSFLKGGENVWGVVILKEVILRTYDYIMHTLFFLRNSREPKSQKIKVSWIDPEAVDQTL